MMRLCTLAAFVSGASALHLSGPMDDRLNACSALVRPLVDAVWISSELL
jgi:hypothetical protein